MKLWDTNILSELARKSPDPALLEWVTFEERPAISAVTVDELFFGLAWQPRPRILAWIENFLESSCEILAVDPVIARLGGQIRGELRARGKVRTQADMLIAATARSHDLLLVTRNVKDFTDCGIRVFDPTSSSASD